MKKRMYVLLTVLSVLFALVGWQALLLGDTISPLPFGAIPGILMAAMTISPLGVGLGIGALVLIYGLLVLSLVFIRKKTRWAMGTGTLIFCLDMAASVVFTAFSWAFLLGIVLDAGLIGLTWWIALKSE